MRGIILIILLIIMSVTVIAADEQYPVLGGDTRRTFHVDGFGQWNAGTDTDEFEYQSVYTGNTYFKVAPKVSNLSMNESYIISFSDGSLRLYQWNDGFHSLDSVDAIQIETGAFVLDSDISIANIDGRFRAVFALTNIGNTSMRVCFVTYNGTLSLSCRSMTEATGFGKYCDNKYGGGGYRQDYNGCETLIGCYGDYCVAAYQKTALTIVIAAFNTTRIVNSTSETVGGAVDDSIAFPIAPVMFVGDANDGDAATDVIFSMSVCYTVGTTKWNATVISYDLSNTGIVSHDWQTYPVSKNGITGIAWARATAGQNEKHQCARRVSSVTVHDIDGAPGNGYEVVVAALHDDSDNFKLWELSSVDGSLKQEHPDIFDIEGQIISNPFVVDCFPDNQYDDIGIMGYDWTAGEITLLCANSVLASPRDDCEYTSYGFANFSYAYIDTYAKTVHSANFDNDGDGTDEIITSYGVFDVERPYYTLANVCTSDITRIFTLNDVYSITYPVDAAGSGRLDLISQTNISLTYYDDLFTNQNAIIDRIQVNPCVNDSLGRLTTWELNTTTQFRVTVIDPESDPVQVRVIMYYGDSNQITSQWYNASSGVRVDVNGMIANKTIAVGYIVVQARDDHHTGANAQSMLFAVGYYNQTGTVAFGDCVTTIDGLYDYYLTGADEELNATVTDLNDNAIINTVRMITESAHVSELVIWLIFMFAAAIGALYINADGAVKIGVLVISQITLLILGAMLGIIPAWILIMTGLGLMVVGGIYFRIVFTGSGG